MTVLPHTDPNKNVTMASPTQQQSLEKATKPNATAIPPSSLLHIKTADRYKFEFIDSNITRLTILGPDLESAVAQPINPFVAEKIDANVERKPLLTIDAVAENIFRVNVVAFPHLGENDKTTKLKSFMTSGPLEHMPHAGRERDDMSKAFGSEFLPKNIEIVEFYDEEENISPDSTSASKPIQVALVSEILTVICNLVPGKFGLTWYYTKDVKNELLKDFGVKLFSDSDSCPSTSRNPIKTVSKQPASDIKNREFFKSATPIVADLPGNSYAYQKSNNSK